MADFAPNIIVGVLILVIIVYVNYKYPRGR